MKNIILDGVEYAPVEKKEWTKQTIKEKTLEWGEISEKKLSWEEANKWCEGQGGRMPTSFELLQAHHDKVEGFAMGGYWSATTYPDAGGQSGAMYVYFVDGSVNGHDKTCSGYVRCVRE